MDSKEEVLKGALLEMLTKADDDFLIAEEITSSKFVQFCNQEEDPGDFFYIDLPKVSLSRSEAEKAAEYFRNIKIPFEGQGQTWQRLYPKSEIDNVVNIAIGALHYIFEFPDDFQLLLRKSWEPDQKAGGAEAASPMPPPDKESSEPKLIHTLCGHRFVVTEIDWSPDGSKLLSRSYDMEFQDLDDPMRVWDSNSGEEIFSLNWKDSAVPDASQGSWKYTVDGSPCAGHHGSPAWSPDGSKLACGGSRESKFDEESCIFVWDATKWSQLHLISTSSTWACGGPLVWSPEGSRLANVYREYRVKVWDIASGSEVHHFKGHKGNVVNVAWSPDGSKLASSSMDKTVKVWDARSGGEIHTLCGHRHAVFNVAWSPNGTKLASCGKDFTVRVWDETSGSEVYPPLEHGDWVNTVEWSPDGSRLASGGGDIYPSVSDYSVRVWDADSGSELYMLEGHEDIVCKVIWSPDGTKIASCSDKTVRVWDVVGGKQIHTIRDHKDVVTDVAWSPDGARLASCSYDKTIKIWSIPR